MTPDAPARRIARALVVAVLLILGPVIAYRVGVDRAAPAEVSTEGGWAPIPAVDDPGDDD